MGGASGWAQDPRRGPGAARPAAGSVDRLAWRARVVRKLLVVHGPAGAGGTAPARAAAASSGHARVRARVDAVRRPAAPACVVARYNLARSSRNSSTDRAGWTVRMISPVPFTSTAVAVPSGLSAKFRLSRNPPVGSRSASTVLPWACGVAPVGGVFPVGDGALELTVTTAMSGDTAVVVSAIRRAQSQPSVISTTAGSLPRSGTGRPSPFTSSRAGRVSVWSSVVPVVRWAAGDRGGPGHADANRLATVTSTAMEMISTG